MSLSEEQKVKSQLDIIDKFIEQSPKMPAVEKSEKEDFRVYKTPENTSLMTETLAKIYLEQKKYTQAIQAYDILILKYPEKSVFFANRIEEIKQLQNIK
jgi:predicted Zn-dependent protease